MKKDIFGVISKEKEVIKDKDIKKCVCSSQKKALYKPNGALEDPRVERFCQIYAADPTRSATGAYMQVYGAEAGGRCLSRRSAWTRASVLLAEPAVKARIAALDAEFVARHYIARDQVLAGFWEVYRRCMAVEPVRDAKGRPLTVKIKRRREDGGAGETEEMAAVYRFDSKGANTALASIARYLGLFNADTSGAAAQVSVSVDISSVRDLITAEMTRRHASDAGAGGDYAAGAAGYGAVAGDADAGADGAGPSGGVYGAGGADGESESGEPETGADGGESEGA